MSGQRVSAGADEHTVVRSTWLLTAREMAWTFGLVTWNLENLLLPDSQFGPQPDVFEHKLEGLPGTIRRMAPDLLGAQEVGSPDALGQLVALT
jgi:hypothetical protein